MNIIIGKSNRILIRPWNEDDAEAWYKLSQNEGLNRFSISGYKQSSLSDSSQFIHKWEQIYKDKKLSVFPVFYKDLKTMMGIVGLKEVTFDNENKIYVELMYRFSSDFWNKGYATESAHLLLRYAFSKLNLNNVVAFIETENTSSMKVLDRLGFKPDRHAIFQGHEVQIYSLSRQDFLFEPQLHYRKLTSQEHSIAQNFYLQVEYKKEVKPTDVIIGAFHNDKLIAAVRLEDENGVKVLRGIQVRYHYAGYGVGKRLLKLFEAELNQNECYCIPFTWLKDFYSHIGFKAIDQKIAPLFLQTRLDDNLHTLIMKKEASR